MDDENSIFYIDSVWEKELMLQSNYTRGQRGIKMYKLLIVMMSR